MTHYLTNYANFTNKSDLDNAVTLHKEAHWQKMNQTDYAVLHVLLQNATEYGVAHVKHRTIEKLVNKSNATVRRSLRKLCTLNIIERIHYVRPVMNGLGANIYVVNPFNEDDLKFPMQLKIALPQPNVHFGEL